MEARRPRQLPQDTAYYLRHLLARRFTLVPSTVPPPETWEGRLLHFARKDLGKMPKSPRLTQAVNESPVQRFQALLFHPDGAQPTLAIRDLGVWTLKLPKYGRRFQSLGELRYPEDVIPASTRVRRKDGREELFHSIPLRSERYDSRAVLTICVTKYESGQLAYCAWVWLPLERRGVPLPWPEALRVITLFQHMAAGAVRVSARPPDGNGATRDGARAARTNGGASGRAHPGKTGTQVHYAAPATTKPAAATATEDATHGVRTAADA